MHIINSKQPRLMGAAQLSSMIAEHHPVIGAAVCPKCNTYVYLYILEQMTFQEQPKYIARFKGRKFVKVECICGVKTTMKRVKLP